MQPPPDNPENDAEYDSWKAYWSRKRSRAAFDARAAAMAPPPAVELPADASPRIEAAVPAPVQHFPRAPIVDGAWNKSDHVRALCNKGFSVSVDTTKRGKCPLPSAPRRPKSVP
jgi:hypothetical protein